MYSAISFTTMQLPCFNVFKQMFYTLNVKTIPNNIYELLTPRELAFLIMDDGSRQGMVYILVFMLFLIKT
jgi:hypothetical protein